MKYQVDGNIKAQIFLWCSRTLKYNDWDFAFKDKNTDKYSIFILHDKTICHYFELVWERYIERLPNE